MKIKKNGKIITLNEEDIKKIIVEQNNSPISQYEYDIVNEAINDCLTDNGVKYKKRRDWKLPEVCIRAARSTHTPFNKVRMACERDLNIGGWNTNTQEDNMRDVRKFKYCLDGIAEDYKGHFDDI